LLRATARGWGGYRAIDSTHEAVRDSAGVHIESRDIPAVLMLMATVPWDTPVPAPGALKAVYRAIGSTHEAVTHIAFVYSDAAEAGAISAGLFAELRPS
jgi:hypothetical protein